MLKSQIYTVATSVVRVVPFAVIRIDGSFDFESFPALLESAHFYSSYAVKLPSPK